MYPLPRYFSLIHLGFHAFSFLLLVFLRFYPGYDYSRSISRTFDVNRLALGWFETWIQWAFWASMIYYVYAAIVDVMEGSKWRRNRDIFYSLVLSSELAILVGYWMIQVPIEVSTGIGKPSHQNWEHIVELYISPTVPPVLALLDFLFVSHRPGNFFVELILVSIFCAGFIVTDIARYSLTHRFVFPIQFKAFGAYWVILAIITFASFLAYRGLSILMIRFRRNHRSCHELLYDSDNEDDSIESRRRLINEDFPATLRYGRTDGQQGQSCLNLSAPAIIMFVIIQSIVTALLINFLVRDRAKHHVGVPSSP